MPGSIITTLRVLRQSTVHQWENHRKPEQVARGACVCFMLVNLRGTTTKCHAKHPPGFERNTRTQCHARSEWLCLYVCWLLQCVITVTIHVSNSVGLGHDCTYPLACHHQLGPSAPSPNGSSFTANCLHICVRAASVHLRACCIVPLFVVCRTRLACECDCE